MLCPIGRVGREAGMGEGCMERVRDEEREGGRE